MATDECKRNEDAVAIAGGRDTVTAAVIPCPPPVGERGR
jgi:hypothetical protein